MDQYTETLDYLYGRLATFHRVGVGAYKPGLDNTLALSKAYGNPHIGLPVIHVGGTNGKGSVAHTLAAVLQSAGLKTGLYTSPHLVDFSERIRVDGHPIEHEAVIDFVNRFKKMELSVDPSFFELCTVMAFEYFKKQGVDVAVVEVGLGGLYDSTNIVESVLSIVTNISLDHTDLLGKTKTEIAAQKAGIFKPGVPALVSEAVPETRAIFEHIAQDRNAPLTFAEDNPLITSYETVSTNRPLINYRTLMGDFESPLTGDCQAHNTNCILHAVNILRSKGFSIDSDSIINGFKNVISLTGLHGRWEKIAGTPEIIADTGHNPGAWQYLGPALQKISDNGRLHMVIGFVGDKDIDTIMQYMPRGAVYHFVQPSTPRAAKSVHVAEIAAANGISGTPYPTVADGSKAALASDATHIFVGGSTFVVADFLNLYHT